MYAYVMITMAVAELKAHFSKVLGDVRNGQTVGILYGKARKPVAMIVPYKAERTGKREIGILDGRINKIYP